MGIEIEWSLDREGNLSRHARLMPCDIAHLAEVASNEQLARELGKLSEAFVGQLGEGNDREFVLNDLREKLLGWRGWWIEDDPCEEGTALVQRYGYALRVREDEVNRVLSSSVVADVQRALLELPGAGRELTKAIEKDGRPGSVQYREIQAQLVLWLNGGED